VATKDSKQMSPMDVVAVLTKALQEQQKMLQKQQKVSQKQQRINQKQQRTISELSKRMAELGQDLRLKGTTTLAKVRLSD